MAAKELKALVDIGTSLGYTGVNLKQWLNDEKKRQEEEKRQEEDKKRAFELEKLKIKAEKEKESERIKLEAEAKRATIEAQKESERMKLEAEAERAKIETEKKSEHTKIEAETDSERRRQEFELRKLEMELDLRLREVQVNVEQDGGGEGGVPSPRSNRGHPFAIKALKLPLFSDEKDDLDAYLIRFERACAAFEIRPAFWSTQLARLLQGRSLDVYQRLPAEEVDNYESLKTQLLKRFHLTEGGYR